MKKIIKPTDFEYALYYEKIIKLVKEDEPVLKQLKENAKQFELLILSLSELQLTIAYAEGKWSIKDILQHIIDVERVFVYRAMRFSRNDKSAQPFFDENAFAKEAKANTVATKRLVKEYKISRQSTLTFFNNQNATTLKRTGIASNSAMSVRACAWIICGHELHHLQVIKEKYASIIG